MIVHLINCFILTTTKKVGAPRELTTLSFTANITGVTRLAMQLAYNDFLPNSLVSGTSIMGTRILTEPVYTTESEINDGLDCSIGVKFKDKPLKTALDMLSSIPSSCTHYSCLVVSIHSIRNVSHYYCKIHRLSWHGCKSQSI